jgi:hypothetical protein
MADEKNERGPQDASRINVNEDYELRYWSKKFALPPSGLFGCRDSSNRRS